MRRNRVRIAFMFVLVAAVPQLSMAGHRGHHGHGGYYGGSPLWWVFAPPLYSYPLPAYRYVDPQPVIIQQPAPTVIVQPSAVVAPSAQVSQSWYYCTVPKGYYPYVTTCPGGWRQVPSTPPGVVP